MLRPFDGEHFERDTSMQRDFSTRRALGRPRTLLAIAGVGSLAAAGAYLAPSAQATTIAYTGTSTGTASTITIHRGDAYQRVLHPEASVTAVLDDTNKKVVSGAVSLKPSYTDTFVVFGLKLYARTDIEQVGQATGSATPGAVDGTTDLTVNAATKLHLTVYVSKDGTHNPATDQTLTDPNKCVVDLPMTLSGSANRRSGALSLHQDPFTIGAFPNGSVDPNLTCGFATGALNAQVAGANNGIDLNFSGGPTSAHYTGVSTGKASTIVIKKGDKIFEKVVNPTGSLVADIDFVNGTTSNVVTKFDPVDIAALPGVLSALPAFAHIDITTVGTPTAALSSSGTPGIDNIAVKTSAKMAVKVSLFQSPGIGLTNPKTCFVTLNLNLTGTVDRGTDTVKLGQPKFTVPGFPLFGCGLLLGPALSLMVSGPNNSIALTYVDGVVPTA